MNSKDFAHSSVGCDIKMGVQVIYSLYTHFMIWLMKEE